jgi:hypothetical protein
MANLSVKRCINYIKCKSCHVTSHHVTSSRHVNILLTVCTKDGYSAPCRPVPVATVFILISLQRRYLKNIGRQKVIWCQYVQYTNLRSRQTAPGSGARCVLPDVRTRNTTIRLDTGQPYARSSTQRVFALVADTHDTNEHYVSRGDLNARTHWKPRTAVGRNCTRHTASRLRQGKLSLMHINTVPCKS